MAVSTIDLSPYDLQDVAQLRRTLESVQAPLDPSELSPYCLDHLAQLGIGLQKLSRVGRREGPVLRANGAIWQELWED